MTPASRIETRSDGCTGTPAATAAFRLADHLLVFNLAMDADDPILGFASEWVNALADWCGRVSVMTMRAGRLAVRDNVRVYSAGGESGLSRVRRVARFYRLLARVIRTDRVDACFSHMMPRFSTLGGPVLKATGTPLVTWYAHPRCTYWLRAAHALSDRMVTSFASTYPYRRDKLRVIGQAIDTTLFSPGFPPAPERRVLYVGRLSPVKKVDVLVEAFARVHSATALSDARLTIIGQPPARDVAYAEHVKDRVRTLGLSRAVEWIPGIAQGDLAAWYRSAMVHVNLTEQGFGDKVALESMSCGVPCIVANEDFKGLLTEEDRWLLVPPGDVDALSERLATALAIPAAERTRLGCSLRRSVEQDHSLATLPQRLGRVIEEIQASRRPAGASRS